jgi:hypothetical protein
MSTQHVQVELLGQEVSAEIVTTREVADYADGLRDELVVAVGGTHYCVDEDDVLQ